MKQSSILKWTHSKMSSNRASNWIHPPDALQRGHVAYLVKFLGFTEVEEPKGIEVVKEGIRKLKFNQQLKRAEGTKTPKVELTISIEGVAIQEPKTKRIYHQYPLHRISYCADDKSDKKFFSFIAKEADNDKHCCFVFVSDKLAEEITLTIGQAFDLAYRRFLETYGRDLEMRKSLMILQKRTQELEKENSQLQKRIAELVTMKDRADIENHKPVTTNGDTPIVNGHHHKNNSVAPVLKPPPPVPPRNHERNSNHPQDLLCDFDNEVPPAPKRPDTSMFLNETITNGNGNGHFDKDLFGADPFQPQNNQNNTKGDPFGMGDFGNCPPVSQDWDSAIGAIDKRLSEMRDGFSRGLSFGNDDFSLESFDPLHNKN